MIVHVVGLQAISPESLAAFPSRTEITDLLMLRQRETPRPRNCNAPETLWFKSARMQDFLMSHSWLAQNLPEHLITCKEGRGEEGREEEEILVVYLNKFNLSILQKSSLLQPALNVLIGKDKQRTSRIDKLNTVT